MVFLYVSFFICGKYLPHPLFTQTFYTRFPFMWSHFTQFFLFQIHTGPGHGLIRTFSMSLHARGPRKVPFRLSSSPSCSFCCCFSFSLPSLCDSFSPSLSFDSLDLFKSRSLGKSLREMTSMPEVRQLTRSPFDVNDENGKRGRFRRPPAQ